MVPVAPAHAPERLNLPASVRGAAGAEPKLSVRWAYTLSIAIMHLLALAAVIPPLSGYFFSWTGVVICLLGLYVFGTLGVNLAFHRLLTHRSFECPRWLERGAALLGVCCLQEGPARWVAIHRKHHQQSDEQPDPHSPLVTFLWGHCGWLMFENRETDSYQVLHKYARDLVSQPFYLALERRLNWLLVYVVHAMLFAAAGLAAGVLIHRTEAGAIDWSAAARFMLSIVLYGVIVRTVLVWHITWSVNSFSHMFGYQSYTNTGENSRNNWFVALISNGEGWHNNHHGDQCCAAHGQKWYEFDVTYLTILALEKLGLARKVRRPSRAHTLHRA